MILSLTEEGFLAIHRLMLTQILKGENAQLILPTGLGFVLISESLAKLAA